MGNLVLGDKFDRVDTCIVGKMYRSEGGCLCRIFLPILPIRVMGASIVSLVMR